MATHLRTVNHRSRRQELQHDNIKRHLLMKTWKPDANCSFPSTTKGQLKFQLTGKRSFPGCRCIPSIRRKQDICAFWERKVDRICRATFPPTHHAGVRRGAWLDALQAFHGFRCPNNNKQDHVRHLYTSQVETRWAPSSKQNIAI